MLVLLKKNQLPLDKSKQGVYQFIDRSVTCTRCDDHEFESRMHTTQTPLGLKCGCIKIDQGKIDQGFAHDSDWCGDEYLKSLHETTVCMRTVSRVWILRDICDATRNR